MPLAIRPARLADALDIATAHHAARGQSTFDDGTKMPVVFTRKTLLS